MIPTMSTLYSDHFIFQQAYVAKKTKNFFENSGIEVLKWSANIPDFNLIENLWAIMKKKLSEILIKNKSELIEKLTRIWKEISEDLLTSLINSMPNRIRACIDADGSHLKY